MKWLLLIGYTLLSHLVSAQGFIPAAVSNDSSNYYQQKKQSFIQFAEVKKKRVAYATIGTATSYGLAIATLANTWYSKYEQRNFHFFNDANDWLQVDKAGHGFTTYQFGRLHSELWRWAGLNDRQRIWIGGLSGTALMGVMEVLDGFSEGWGFSTSDFAANLAGSTIFISQELGWKDQRIQLKYSFAKPNYSTAQLNTRASELFGDSYTEKILKDYNGQTFWASINLRSFFPRSSLPKWLNLAIGYGASGMFGGSENLAKDQMGNISFDARNVSRYRQWYISPDIDLTRIRTKSKWLKAGFFLLNAIKIPAPTLGVSKNGLDWKWIQ